MQARQLYVYRKIISDTLRWLFEAWKKTFAYAMNASYNVSKPVVSKAKEKRMTKSMYVLLDGEADRLPWSSSSIQTCLIQDPVLSRHYTIVRKTEQSLKFSDVFSSTYYGPINISASLWLAQLLGPISLTSGCPVKCYQNVLSMWTLTWTYRTYV